MTRSEHVMVVVMMGLTTGAAMSATDEVPAGPPTRPMPTSLPSPAGPQHVQPQANRVLRAWSNTLQAASRFQLDVETRVRVRGADLTTDLKSTYQLVVERPNRLAIRPERPALDPMLVCDGTTLWSLLPATKQYTLDPAPASLDHLLAGNAANVLLAGGSALGYLTLLLARDPYDDLTILATDGRYVGTEEVDGVPCHHVKLVQHVLEFDLWITTGPRPLLRKLVPSIIATPQAETAPGGVFLAPPAPKVKLETTLTFSNWTIGEPLPPGAFSFVPPPGAERVERLLTATGREEPDPRVGQPAPTFTMPLLDGSTFDLAAHQGRDAVVLDFWASWSAGSAERLPAHARLAKEYAGRRVVFLALNLDLPERLARGHLEKNGIDLPAAVDRDAAVAKRYGVEKLPQTVVIAPNGRVQAVHGWLPARIDTPLRAEIDLALGGGPATQPAGAENQQPR